MRRHATRSWLDAIIVEIVRPGNFHVWIRCCEKVNRQAQGLSCHFKWGRCPSPSGRCERVSSKLFSFSKLEWITTQNNALKRSTTFEICRLRLKLNQPTLPAPQTVAPLDSQISLIWATVWFRPHPAGKKPVTKQATFLPFNDATCSRKLIIGGAGTPPCTGQPNTRASYVSIAGIVLSSALVALRLTGPAVSSRSRVTMCPAIDNFSFSFIATDNVWPVRE